MRDLNQYSRFFAFGDSYTNYYWPTYADIIGTQCQYYENWGLKGAGNHYIYNSVVECNQRNRFNSNDLVIVMWTGITREDRYVDNHWATATGDYRRISYGEEWMRRYGTEVRGNLIRDLAYIVGIDNLLNTTGCEYYFLSSIGLILEDQDVVELYKDIINKIKPSLYDTIKDSVRPNFNDIHPTPVESAHYINQHLGIDYDGDFVNYWEGQVRNIELKNTLPVPYNRPVINRL